MEIFNKEDKYKRHAEIFPEDCKRDKNVSAAQIALGWLLHQPVVTSVIIGANTPEQLVDTLAAPEVKFSTEELARLNEVSELPSEYPGWMLKRQAVNRFPEKANEA